MKVPRCLSATRASAKLRQTFTHPIEVVKDAKIFERPDLTSRALSLVPKGHSLLTDLKLSPTPLRQARLSLTGIHELKDANLIKVYDS